LIRIGLVSDTHIPKSTHVLPPQIKEAFKDVDLIFHAGDIYVVSVLDELEHLAPVLAAEGDDDYPEVKSDRRVKKEHVLTVEGINLHLTHFLAGRPWERHSIPTKDWFEGVTDIFVYGDTHIAKVDYNEGVLLVNPGSPTYPDYQRKLGTVGILTITSGKVGTHILQLC